MYAIGNKAPIDDDFAIYCKDDNASGLLVYENPLIHKERPSLSSQQFWVPSFLIQLEFLFPIVQFFCL